MTNIREHDYIDFNRYGMDEITVGGYRLTVYCEPDDKISYVDYYGRERTATRRPAEWTKHLHGNAPSGTFYGSYRIITPDGKRHTVRTYL